MSKFDRTGFLIFVPVSVSCDLTWQKCQLQRVDRQSRSRLMNIVTWSVSAKMWYFHCHYARVSNNGKCCFWWTDIFCTNEYICEYGCGLSGVSDDSLSCEAVDDVRCTETLITRQHQQHQRRAEMKNRRRRRIVHVIDSSTEDDPDISDQTSNFQRPPNSKQYQTSVAQSVGTREKRTSNQNHARFAEFTGSGRPSSTGSGQPGSVKRSEHSKHTAEYTGSDHTALTGSGQLGSVNRSVLSVSLKSKCSAEVKDCFSSRIGSKADVNSVKSVDDMKSLNADVRAGIVPLVTRPSVAAAGDVATFSLALDEFLDSEDDNDDDIAAEFTQIKPLRDRISAVEKPSVDSPHVLRGSSDGVGLCRSGQPGLNGSWRHNSVRSECCITTSASSRLCSRTVPQSDYKTGSDQPCLIGSGQPNSLMRSAPSTTDRSCSAAVLRLERPTMSSQRDLTGSVQPSCINNSAASEAERQREERIRLSRLKKEEFQRRFAKASPSASQLPTNSAADDTVRDGDVADIGQTKRRVLVDSRELSGAQVICGRLPW